MTEKPIRPPSRIERLAAVMRAHWPDTARRRAVAQGYKVMRAHPHVIADIALRNYVLTPAPQNADAIMLARIEGKREAALDIMRLTKTDLEALLALR